MSTRLSPHRHAARSGAAAFARAHGFRYVEEQHNADCLKHALSNLLFSTDRLPDDMFDGKRGLTLVVARLVSQERDYWDFDMIKWFVAATAITSTSTLNTSIPMPSAPRSLSNV